MRTLARANARAYREERSDVAIRHGWLDAARANARGYREERSNVAIHRRRHDAAHASVVALLALAAFACRGGERDAGPASTASRAATLEPTALQAGAGAGRVQVVVSVAPLAFLVDRIGGQQVHTVVLAPPGADPHGWEPTPRQLAAVERADLFVAVGHPGFPFEQRFLTTWREDHPGLEVVSLAGAPSPGADAELASDPHLWVAPAAVRAAAPRIAAALAARDPGHAAAYGENLAALLADVDAVDARLAAILRDRRGRAFLAYHAAWGHLAHQYGLRQLAVDRNGREPGPRQMVAVVERARAERVAVVFAQRGASRQGAEVLAAELGAEVVELDPMAYDWLASMSAVADAFARAFDAA